MLEKKNVRFETPHKAKISVFDVTNGADVTNDANAPSGHFFVLFFLALVFYLDL